MSLPTDIRPVAASVYFIPVQTRVPLKFGAETLTHVTVSRVKMTVTDRAGRTAEGWGETPLSVQWVWPSTLSTQHRLDVMKQFTLDLARAWAQFDSFGHALEVGHDFIEEMLPVLMAGGGRGQATGDRGQEAGAQTGNSKSQISNLKSEISNHGFEIESLPHLAALVCCSPFDIALHDAYGKLQDKPIYETYNARFMSRGLSSFLSVADGSDVSFSGLFPADFLTASPPSSLKAWHLVGGVDLLADSQRTGSEPEDGYPVTLKEWIERDGLSCLKIKLRGNDPAWDFQRIVSVNEIFDEALRRREAASGVEVEGWLTADFNCTVTQPAYVNDILDRLRDEHPRAYQRLLYVEQPFPYDLEKHRIDVHSVSARKPLFMDESAHDWKLVKLGRSLGWTGVALKTCKTQTGAILSACWAKAHGMTLMVQDLTNPMLAQIPHVLLAAHTGTIMGVETNAMQFYPEASSAEAKVHPGLYRRRDGCVDLSTIQGAGFGYRLDEMSRALPEAAIEVKA